MQDSKATLEETRSLFERMGYVVVHNWYESHGNGGSVIMQRPGYSSSPDCMVLAYNRDHNVFRVYPEGRNQDYLLAREILEDQKDPDGPSWIPVNGSKISPCCTAGVQDYHYPPLDQYVRITSIAGHGTYATPIKANEAGKASWY